MTIASYAVTQLNVTQCPPGTYQWEYGTSSESECIACPAGYVCPSYSTTLVSNSANGRRGQPSVTGSDTPCGGIDVYCPAGSSQPTPVQVVRSPATVQQNVTAASVVVTDRLNQLIIAIHISTACMQWLALIGYYSTGQANDGANAVITRTGQSLCEPGYYCTGGIPFSAVYLHRNAAVRA
eukprot:14874-Heterococcus_DN1.PRE.4